MLDEDLFRKILIDPVEEDGADRLLVVSGFATANMADHHMERPRELDRPLEIELIVGMARSSAVDRAQHLGCARLAGERPYGTRFRCLYVVEGNPVHAKTYCWMRGDEPVRAFVGSANYSRAGFGGRQVEAMAEADPAAAARFHERIRGAAADCADESALAGAVEISDGAISAVPGRADGVERRSVSLSLLRSPTGETPERSGINWGRGRGGIRMRRIAVPADVARSGFFPERAEKFTVLADDSRSFVMARAQDGGKALHTTQDNALLGRYLRSRMGVGPGERVTRRHLVEYGRADVTFTRIDGETYLMDFRPDPERET